MHLTAGASAPERRGRSVSADWHALLVYDEFVLGWLCPTVDEPEAFIELGPVCPVPSWANNMSSIIRW
jgi:hypothetical protein